MYEYGQTVCNPCWRKPHAEGDSTGRISAGQTATSPRAPEYRPDWSEDPEMASWKSPERLAYEELVKARRADPGLDGETLRKLKRLPLHELDRATLRIRARLEEGGQVPGEALREEERRDLLKRSTKRWYEKGLRHTWIEFRRDWSAYDGKYVDRLCCTCCSVEYPEQSSEVRRLRMGLRNVSCSGCGTWFSGVRDEAPALKQVVRRIDRFTDPEPDDGLVRNLAGMVRGIFEAVGGIVALLGGYVIFGLACAAGFALLGLILMALGALG